VAIEKALSWSNRLHICHLSTLPGAGADRRGKGKGKASELRGGPLIILFFNVKDYRQQGTFLKMNPPLRHQEDNDALWAGLRAGKIDILASDHAPHLPEEKRDDIWDAPPGVPGVETMAPLILKEVADGRLPLHRFIDMTTANPARIFGINNKGHIEEATTQTSYS